MAGEVKRSRRALLMLAAAAGAAAAGTKLAVPSRAQAAELNIGDFIPVGQTSTMPEQQTDLVGDSESRVLQVWNNNTGKYAAALSGIGRTMGLSGSTLPSTGAPSMPSGSSAGVRARGGSYGVYATGGVANSTGVHAEGSLRGVEAFGFEYGTHSFSTIGIGVYGLSGSQAGVSGEGNPGVRGFSSLGAGVYGESSSGAGVLAKATGTANALKVEGPASFSIPPGPGAPAAGADAARALQVEGSTRLAASSGVALSVEATGGAQALRVQGGATISTPAGAVLRVESTGGGALAVQGPVSFSSAGLGQFAAGERSKAVTDVSTPPGSKILVTLNVHPGRGNALLFVRRDSDSGFTVHLTKPAARGVSFSYFVIA